MQGTGVVILLPQLQVQIREQSLQFIGCETGLLVQMILLAFQRQGITLLIYRLVREHHTLGMGSRLLLGLNRIIMVHIRASSPGDRTGRRLIGIQLADQHHHDPQYHQAHHKTPRTHNPYLFLKMTQLGNGLMPAPFEEV